MIWPYHANIDDPDQLKNKNNKTSRGEVIKNKLVEPGKKEKESRVVVVENKVNFSIFGIK